MTKSKAAPGAKKSMSPAAKRMRKYREKFTKNGTIKALTKANTEINVKVV